MWSNSTDRLHYYRLYRTAPVKLVPSIISCQASCCLLVFGIFIFIGGCMSRFIGGAEDFDDDEDFGRIPRIIGTTMMVIGGLLIGGAIIAIIVAFVYYRDYQKSRSETATNNAVYSHAGMINGSTAQLPISGVYYPTQRIDHERPPDYQTATLHTAYYPSAAPNDPVIEGNAFARAY